MRLAVYVGVLLLFQIQVDGNSNDEQCIYSVYKYKYIFKAVFQYVPTTIINQTTLNIRADVDYYQGKSSCNQSFIRLRNLMIDSYENASAYLDNTELEKSILEIFHQKPDIIVSDNYTDNTNEYRRIQTSRTNDGQFLGNSILANYLLNKFFSPTKTTCEYLINLTEQKLETSTCQSTTAGLLIINREIYFVEKIEDLPHKNQTFIPLVRKTKDDFDRLLKQICFNMDQISDYRLIEIMNNELNDDELNEILLDNTTKYSNCERTIINRHILKITRYQATEYLLKRFSHNESTIEYHFDIIERQFNDQFKQIFRKFLNNSSQISSLIELRMLILIGDDNLTMEYGLNRANHWRYRAVLLRILNNPTHFHHQFRTILNNEHESDEIRILAFEHLLPMMNPSEIKNLIEIVQSSQLRWYMKSLFKQSSIWLGNSGSYQFPFGKINMIFHNHFPSIMQCVFANQTEIDLYFLRNSEIWLIVGRISILRFWTIQDLWKWFENDRLFEIPTLDGFILKMNFQQSENFFHKFTTGIILTVQHGIAGLFTGYQMNFRLQSNLKVHIDQNEQATSYIWRSIQKENVVLQIKQTIRPFRVNQSVISTTTSSSSSTKDFCYLIPHFDSKICLSFIFEYLWPSLISIRLLSDDHSLIYNFTTSDHFIRFDIQQNEQILRSYRLLRRYDQHPSMPTYLEFSSPTTNYTSFIEWNNQSKISFHLLKNHRSIANGSGVYKLDSTNRCSIIQLTDINPNHIGTIVLNYNGNFTINARNLLGGELSIQIDRFPNWKHVQLRIESERKFFFFQQNFSCHFAYDIDRSSFNLTIIRNENNRFQWIWLKNNSHFDCFFNINTSLIEFNHRTQAYYHHFSNMGLESISMINGWSLWNISGMINNAKEVQIHLNRIFLRGEIDNRMILLEINSFNHRLLRGDFRINQSNSIDILFEIPGYRYTSEGKLSADYTNLTLDFPLIENQKKKSHIHFIFSSFSNHLIFNLTSHFRNQYFFTSLYNLTFLHNYFYQSTIQSSLNMLHYPLFSFNFSAQYLPNSTILQSVNSSFILPSLFVNKPLLLTYKKHSHLWIQFFQWANFTHTANTSNISTLFGLQLSIINELPSRLSIHLEQRILGQRYLFLFLIDEHWLISFTLNRQIRYEFLSIPSDSRFLIQQIHLPTNQTRQLPINYHTDNQTLIRIEILFSKYFSTFINDFIVELSWQNQTFKFLCHIPLFRREFFVLTWKRYFQKEFGHFHGLIEMRIFRRRRLIDYQYDWNLASWNVWTFDSHLILFSFDPIQWNLNITNDYLWNGKWIVDFRLRLGNRRDLIRLHHQYHYTRLRSNLLFNFHLINADYDLNLNYDHLNHSIAGIWMRNKYSHQINGYWNTTENKLQLNTQHIKSMTIISSKFIKLIIEKKNQKIGVLFERSRSAVKNITQIIECNPSLIIQSYPQLFLIHYYTLNDGLSTMIFEWLTHSYFSWNYTGHHRMPFPLRKFHIDIRTKYLFYLHTTTFKYSAIYNHYNSHLTIRREPIGDDADDRYALKIKSYRNQTFFIHLQIINNHYEIIINPSRENNSSWNLHGYFRKDHFNGSVIFSHSDWLFSSKLNFNSSLFISTGRYVQLIPTSDSQIALELLLKSRLHLVFQYAGLRSLIAGKFFHNASNMTLYFVSKSINQTIFNLQFQLNRLINQNWTLEINDARFCLYDHHSEFRFNGSLEDISFEHFIGDQKNEFFLNENSLGFTTSQFRFILANLSSDTTRNLHISHQPSNQNLTIHYYKSGRFARDDLNIQTPIYDINVIYYPSDDDNRYVKIFFEFLPLQMSAFNLVRGRTFRLGYETKQKQCILSGNLALGIEDIDKKDFLTMTERWKLIYGFDRSERIYIKWNIRIDLNQTSLQGRVNIEDPNGDMSIPFYSDIRAHLQDMILVTDIRTVYSSTENPAKPIILQLNIDKRFLTQQFISLKIIHEPSKTNLSFAIDHYPQRRFLLRLKPNNFLTENIFLHLYANTTESQLKLLLILADQIHLNLTLPKSYPETGLLYSALFIDNEEYFDGRLDATALRFRTKEYLCNISFNQLVLQKRMTTQQILASIVARWIEKNSSTALVTVFTRTDFQRISIPSWQSAAQFTWLQRFRQFLFANNLTSEFGRDLDKFFGYLKTDFINEHGQFGTQLIDYLKLDEDFQLALQRMNSHALVLINTFFQISLFGEKLFQEYLNNLTCLIHHQNLIHLDISQLTTLTINTLTYETIHYLNQTLIMFNYFTRYPRSFTAVISYINDEIILNAYQLINSFYLETKQYFLSQLIHYSHEMEFLIKISPLLSDSITFLSSNDIRAMVYFLNDRVRRLLSIWMNSPLEYKIMKTIASQLIELIERFRFHLNDKLDFLLPNLKIYTPQIWINSSINQTFLLTWSKQYNLTNIIEEE